MNLDFDKMHGLIPAIIQDSQTGKVLMLGFMNREAYEQTKATGRVTFFSRSKQRLWTKGETSGNALHVVDILTDCDHDALLIKATPDGPVCHTGSDTCFGEDNSDNLLFLHHLQTLIESRKREMPQGSYVATLFADGVQRIAQKVGEEAVETVIEATGDNNERLISEAADLLFHLLVLLSAKNLRLQDLCRELRQRHKP